MKIGEEGEREGRGDIYVRNWKSSGAAKAEKKNLKLLSISFLLSVSFFSFLFFFSLFPFDLEELSPRISLLPN